MRRAQDSNLRAKRAARGARNENVPAKRAHFFFLLTHTVQWKRVDEIQED